MNMQPIYDERQILPKVGDIYLYTVRPGDHLYELARRYNSSVEMIQGINGLAEGATLQIGQELFIPVISRKPTQMPMRAYAPSYPAMYY